MGVSGLIYLQFSAGFSMQDWQMDILFENFRLGWKCLEEPESDVHPRQCIDTSCI